MHRPAARLLFAASALALAAPASAQEAAGGDEIVITAQALNASGVVRAGQLGALGAKEAADVPFSVKSYNAALILNQQPTTLGQVLENDPTIRTTYGFGNAAETFVIRGYELSSDDLALDGLYGLAPRQLVAPELYENVQVLNGASAFLFGAAPSGGAVGGSVNLVPKRAGEGELTRLTGNWISDAHFGGAVDVSRRFGENGEWGVRINGAARRGELAIDDEFRSTYVAAGAIDYRGAAVRLSLDLAYQRYKVSNLRTKVQLGALTAIPRVPRARANYNQSWSYSTLRDVFGIVKGEWDVADNATLYGSFGARDGSERGIYDGITVTDAVTGAATGSALFVPRTDNNEAAQAGIRVRLAQGGISHEVNVGGSALWQVNRNAFDFLGGFAGFPTNLYNTPAVPLPGTGFVGGDLNDPFPVSRTQLWSAFASDTIGVWGNRVLLTTGLRLQHVRNKSYNYADGALSQTYESEAATPILGLVVKPVEGLSLFANRVEALTPTGTAGASGAAPNGQLLPVSNANETLPPAKSTQYEVGGKLAVGRLNASIALFRINRPRAPQLALDADRPGFLIFEAAGRQRNRGIEFSIDGEIARGLRVIAGGSVIDAEFRGTGSAALDGKTAPGVPDYLLNGYVEYDLPFLRGLTLTGRVVHTGEQEANAANTLKIPDWTRVDFGARYVAVVAEQPLTFRFTVDNVANRRFWTSSYDSFSPQLLQGAPRTFKLSASIDL